MGTPSNFSVLTKLSPLLAGLGSAAEKPLQFDPASGVLKQQLLGEGLVLEIAAKN